MSVTAHRTPPTGAHAGTISTAEIKARIAAMFADEPTADPDLGSSVVPLPPN